MKPVLQIISILALIVTIAPACVYLAGSAELAATKNVMLAATAVWFAVAPFAWQREGKHRTTEPSP